uniref:Uncharacterized protein n=2 Tax=Timema TaxID=61471 RepID=A0A7R9AUQ0_TIMSH|nr:unnamed protein product [Timema shepardi]CAD7571816.1 unnamed protein product [Timema californicum]
MCRTKTGVRRRQTDVTPTVSTTPPINKTPFGDNKQPTVYRPSGSSKRPSQENEYHPVSTRRPTNNNYNEPLITTRPRPQEEFEWITEQPLSIQRYSDATLDPLPSINTPSPPLREYRPREPLPNDSWKTTPRSPSTRRPQNTRPETDLKPTACEWNIVLFGISVPPPSFRDFEIGLLKMDTHTKSPSVPQEPEYKQRSPCLLSIKGPSLRRASHNPDSRRSDQTSWKQRVVPPQKIRLTNHEISLRRMCGDLMVVISEKQEAGIKRVTYLAPSWSRHFEVWDLIDLTFNRRDMWLTPVARYCNDLIDTLNVDFILFIGVQSTASDAPLEACRDR